MKTAVFKVQEGEFLSAVLEHCENVLRAGGVIVLPTDTVYGLACNAFHPEGIQKIYALKGRSYTKPLPIFLSGAAQLSLVAREVLRETAPLIDSYWPGPLTLVFKTAPMALGATRGKASVAIRIPDHGFVRDLLDRVQVPLAVTSANKSGKGSCAHGAEVKKAFNGRVDVIIDGGDCAVGKESSVVDVTHYPFTVLREGAISKSELTKRLNLG